MSVIISLFIFVILANDFVYARGQAIGESVCVEGFVMDNLCIDRGTLLDNSSVKTLEGPERHSVHCLVDVSSCRSSGFTILKGPVSGLYSVAFQIDTAGTATLVELGRQVGTCSTCEPGGSLSAGLRAEVFGIVTALGSDSLAPTLQITSAKVSNGQTAVCAENTPVTSSPITNAPVTGAPVTKAPITSMKAPVKPPALRVPTVQMPKAPVKAPVRPPVKAPVRPPAKAPVRPPVKAPVRSPVKAPVRAPVKPPVKSPVRSPVKRAPTMPTV